MTAGSTSATMRFALGFAIATAVTAATIAGQANAGTLPPPDTRCLGEQADIIGSPDADVLEGTAGDDVIVGLGGDDRLVGFAGEDLLCGGDGVDTVEGDQNRDFLVGGEQGDFLAGGPGEDASDGEGGDDFVVEPKSDKAPNHLLGGDDNDQLFGASGKDELSGHAGSDKLYGQGSRDELKGGSEDDTVEAGPGNDFVDGGSGGDLLLGDGGRDEVLGDADSDIVAGGPGDDGGFKRGLWGGTGRDLVAGDAGADYIVGEGDVDVLAGDAGPDELFGKEDNDRCEGGPGRDFCDGGEPTPKQKSKDPDICEDDVERQRSCREDVGPPAWTGTATGTATYDGNVKEEFTASYTLSRFGKNVYTGDGTLTWTLSGTDTNGCTHEGSGTAPIDADLTLDPRNRFYYHSLSNLRTSEVTWQGTCPDGSQAGGSFRPLDWGSTESGNYGGVESSDLFDGPHQSYEPGQTTLAGSRTYTADAGTSDPEQVSWQWTLTGAGPSTK